MKNKKILMYLLIMFSISIHKQISSKGEVNRRPAPVQHAGGRSRSPVSVMPSAVTAMTQPSSVQTPAVTASSTQPGTLTDQQFLQNTINTAQNTKITQLKNEISTLEATIKSNAQIINNAIQAACNGNLVMSVKNK